MLVMIVERSPASLRGELSRWLIQLRPGVFLGNPSRRVREELWVKACKKNREGTVTQIWTAPNEQGFAYRQYGVLGLSQGEVGRADKRVRSWSGVSWRN